MRGVYGHRLNLYRSTTPHDGYNVLRKWYQSERPFCRFTSNVDGGISRAGFEQHKINECHGSLRYVQYVEPRFGQEIWSALKMWWST